ncbi:MULTISPECIES: copper chaperone PCu(A)C [unclassified Marinobacter]|uniref:copper chaperone PCu(A)C n=1 Tax=unclassified Marinobacter TaxID=83889 RepID=UPI0026E48BB5|nr:MULTISPECIES: copper chaperone PCu(A)C [unclassified Marinobacter]MDO6441035.1 copper chaperone PCu(A)C [Marinobacter sp. 2_MG-2023]MDO6823871.1 copper chaperone PCu(A)C [Marinobacter sp. 1_MG-2023]
MKKLITLLFATSALIVSVFANVAMAHEYSHGNIAIDHPWSRPTPPGTPMGVGYMVIENHGDRDITLVSASTPRAGHVSIHETQMRDGVMRMQPLKSGLVIPAGKAVELKPHSYHLMLEKLPKPLKEGENIPVTLEFEGADAIEVELTVESLDSDMKKPEMDHSGHHMDH